MRGWLNDSGKSTQDVVFNTQFPGFSLPSLDSIKATCREWKTVYHRHRHVEADLAWYLKQFKLAKKNSRISAIVVRGCIQINPKLWNHSMNHAKNHESHLDTQTTKKKFEQKTLRTNTTRLWLYKEMFLFRSSVKPFLLPPPHSRRAMRGRRTESFKIWRRPNEDASGWWKLIHIPLDLSSFPAIVHSSSAALISLLHMCFVAVVQSFRQTKEPQEPQTFLKYRKKKKSRGSDELQVERASSPGSVIEDQHVSLAKSMDGRTWLCWTQRIGWRPSDVRGDAWDDKCHRLTQKCLPH